MNHLTWPRYPYAYVASRLLALTGMRLWRGLRPICRAAGKHDLFDGPTSESRSCQGSKFRRGRRYTVARRPMACVMPERLGSSHPHDQRGMGTHMPTCDAGAGQISN